MNTYYGYFTETAPEKYRFLGFYQYRRRQVDFTFSFQKEADILRKCLESLKKTSSEDVKKRAGMLLQGFDKHRARNQDVNSLWNEIESMCNNNEEQRLESERTLRTKRCHVNISSKTQCMMENIAEETVEVTKKRLTRKRKSICYSHTESSKEKDYSSDPDYIEKPRRNKKPRSNRSRREAEHDGMDKDDIIEETSESSNTVFGNHHRDVDNGEEAVSKKNKVGSIEQEQLKTNTEGSEINIEARIKKNSKVNELFEGMRRCNIYLLCGQFRTLSEMDAEDRFETILRDSTVNIDIPKNIKEYLQNLLSGNIECVLSKIEKPLSRDAQPLLLWTREVCRHFILYYYYGGLEVNGDEKTWSNQTVYRILDLFSMFFRKLTSGISLGEIVNEAHKDRVCNINIDQKPSSSNRGDKNDAVVYQDENATIIYEQSFGPTEFDTAHYLEDITKFGRNGVDDINQYFIQYPNSSITTAKKLKSIGMHGYKNLISIYLTDLISCRTYRLYEIFSCKIPTTFADRWLLVKIANIGVYLEALLMERKSIKEKLGEEDTINESDSDCVHNWMSIPDNTPEKKKKLK